MYSPVSFRINRGPTKGYEADVGTKTTHRVMYPESASHLDNATSLVLFPFKMKDFLWLIDAFKQGKNSAVNSKRRANKDLVMILNPALMKYVHDIWLEEKGHHPSSGFLTLALSMQICDEIDMLMAAMHLKYDDELARKKKTARQLLRPGSAREKGVTYNQMFYGK
ncbi:CMP-N-acetylneuraminate-beta-galactosamide-alpha-2,3-sialyltransferase 1-like [Cottoperca gobio]|uniref:CMP-N-acetylneuraminate-beta-galactosamide- alpha-2,3-sialyltransferase 1-like n=1 Tax=Cottoperca gobio TaxID=56716 RepID=A0A6J2QV16_COTGO|nr:CMP-N-acetylneuraminate-beta-galactosamide-alpha-2,3-sialyltransferase 1-like [Cottoperca gobio]